MVDFDWNGKMASSSDSSSPNRSSNPTKHIQLSVPVPFRAGEIPIASPPSCCAYEHYFRLPELRKLWGSKEFPQWENETLLKPTLQALEVTFRLVATVFSDPRPYSNRREWNRRLASIATTQISIIAALCEEEDGAVVPIVDQSSSAVLPRSGSSAEVWKIQGETKTTVVSRISEESLLPRLATWQKSSEIAQKIFYSIECEMLRCSFTLGIGEPNLDGKPNLEYDLICTPKDLHSLKNSPYERIENYENQTVYTTHQILESWIFAGEELLKRIESQIENKKFEKAASDCHLLERIWHLLEEIEDLHLLMDPDDFLKLKKQLAIKTLQDSEAFCFRSTGLVEMTRQCRDLKRKVPYILEVEVDPKGGPRIQEAAMKIYREKKEPEKISVLQALQAMESAMKRFFFAYKQVLVVIMGSLEAKSDSLSQIFLEPTYFPSLDAAKTFLGSHPMNTTVGSDGRGRRSG